MLDNTAPVNQDSLDLSSQMRNTIMVFVSKFILVLCIPLAGFFVYILNITEQNINTRADNKIMQIERAYIKNIVSLDILDKKMKAYKEYHTKHMMGIVATEFQKLQGEIVTRKYVAGIEKDLQSRISRSYLKAKSNLDRFKLDSRAIAERKFKLEEMIQQNKNTRSLLRGLSGKAAMPQN